MKIQLLRDISSIKTKAGVVLYGEKGQVLKAMERENKESIIVYGKKAAGNFILFTKDEKVKYKIIDV